jgi:hypothetical protein
MPHRRTAGITSLAAERRAPAMSNVEGCAAAAATALRYPAMVFMILTRSGFDELFPRLVKDRDAVWVNAGVLAESEVGELREAGWNLTKWTNPSIDLATEIGTVQLHHPHQVVWMETAAGTDAG